MPPVSYPLKVPLARLFEKTSARETTYFQGRLGAAKLVLLRSQELSESGEPVWELSVQEPTTAAPPKTVTPQSPPFRLELSHRPGILSRGGEQRAS
jgi:hypothetical protein